MNKFPLLLLLFLLATPVRRLPGATSPAQLRAALVAVVDERPILGSDIRERMSPAVASLRRRYANDPVQLAQKLKEQEQAALESLINDELILTEAVAAGRQVTEEHLDRYVQNQIETNYYADSNVFLKTLAAQGMTVEEFRDRHARNDLVAAAKWEKAENLPPPTSEQIEQFYHAHAKEFWVEESVKLSLIVLNKDPTNGLAAVESQRKLAAELHALLAAGRDFADVAQTYTQDRGGHNGGDWGWVERPVLRRELADAAFALKPGHISDVIETESGFYILRVTDYRPAASRSLAEARTEVARTLAAQAHSAAMAQWLKDLRSRTFIRYYGGIPSDSGLPSNPVVGIEIKQIGVATLEESFIRLRLCVKEGDRVNLARMDRDVRNLYDTGDFYDIRVAEAPADGGSKLIYYLQERPMLDSIQFTGNKAVSRDDLLPKLASKPGARLDERKQFRDAQLIRAIYHRAGYPRATVKYVIDLTEQTGHSRVTFEIVEGPGRT